MERQLSPSQNKQGINVFVAIRNGAGCMQGIGSCFVITVLYLGIGTAMFSSLEEQECDAGLCKWSVIDSIYFCIVTMSTVGYGDISPATDGGRMLALLWIILGIVFVFSSIASNVGRLFQPVSAKGRQILEHLFPQEGVDLNGDGNIDYQKPRHWVVYYGKNMSPSLLIFIVLELVCAVVFTSLEDMNMIDAVYHCITTATTVGYGDIPITTDEGKLWAVFQIVLSVSLLGDAIGTIDTLRNERTALLAKVKLLSCKFDQTLLDKLMVTAHELRPKLVRDGLGLTELEFVIATLIELEVVDVGRVTPFLTQFRDFDFDGSGRLGQADLEMMARGELRKEASMDVAARSLNFTAPPAPASQAWPEPPSGTESATGSATGELQLPGAPLGAPLGSATESTSGELPCTPLH